MHSFTNNLIHVAILRFSKKADDRGHIVVIQGLNMRAKVLFTLWPPAPGTFPSCVFLSIKEAETLKHARPLQKSENIVAAKDNCKTCDVLGANTAIAHNIYRIDHV